MPYYLLPKHVFVCVNEGHVVFLDLKADEYTALERAATTHFNTLIHGWSESSEAGQDGKASVEPYPDELLKSMVDNGLLTTDASTGKDAAPLVADPPLSSVSDDFVLGRRPNVRSSHLVNFLTASAAAAWKLRRHSIERIVRDVQRRKKLREKHLAEFDFEAASELAAIFATLRPLLFTARDACLFDSLALVELLARHRLYATWTFGVRTTPFVAHCWVQQAGLVLNDHHEHVRMYTPIMAV